MDTRYTSTELKQDISNILLDITGPSSFAYGSKIPNPPNPGLYIKDHGVIGMPLSQYDAKVIISKSQQSPFGKGSKTLVDTCIRKSWELDTSQFTIRNPLWDQSIRDLVTVVYKELALTCGAQNITAQLYKLLLYEQGAFFKPHQDTEKTPGMFGTLAISLPSLHEGGDLILYHNKEKVEFKTSSFSEFGSSFAAWYSDVTHEVKPVTSGYRLVLTYNLVRLNNAQMNVPPTLSSHTSRLRPVLQCWESSLNMENSTYPFYLIHKLEHQYTQASLAMDRLQGQDLAQAQFLKTVCESVGFGTYLGIMEKMILKDDDEYDEEYERTLRLKHVQELDGRKLIDLVDLQEDYILEGEGTDDDEPDESEHEGYTGNAGATATYWYRDAVLILVPSSRKVDFLFQGSCPHMSIQSQLRVLGSSAKEDSIQRNQFLRLCNLVVSQPKSRSSYIYGSGKEEGSARRENREFVALCAIELGRFDLYDSAVSSLPANLPLIECARGLGLAFKEYGLGLIQPRLDRALQAVITVKAKYDIWTSFDTGVRQICASVNADKTKEIYSYLENTLEGIVDLKGPLNKEDGKTLATISTESGMHAFIQDRILPHIAQSTTPTKVGFAIRLLSRNAGDKLQESDRQAFTLTALEYVWQDFSFDTDVIVSDQTPGVDILSNPFNNDDLFVTGNDIMLLIEKSNDVLPNFDMAQLCEKLCTAISIGSIDSLKHAILPLVKLMVVQNAPPFTITEQDPSQPSRDVVKTALEALVRNFIGMEPQAPKTWTLPGGGCGCRDCSGVNVFLADPRQVVGQFPCGKSRRAHLHKCFTDKPNRSYTVETLRYSNPNVWQITKNRDTHNRKHQEWKARFASANKFMAGLVRSGRLKQYLGADFNAMISLRVEKLLSQKARAPPALLTDSLKRPLEDDGNVGNREKRTDWNVFNTASTGGEVEVIDLT